MATRRNPRRGTSNLENEVEGVIAPGGRGTGGAAAGAKALSSKSANGTGAAAIGIRKRSALNDLSAAANKNRSTTAAAPGQKSLGGSKDAGKAPAVKGKSLKASTNVDEDGDAVMKDVPGAVDEAASDAQPAARQIKAKPTRRVAGLGPSRTNKSAIQVHRDPEPAAVVAERKPKRALNASTASKDNGPASSKTATLRSVAGNAALRKTAGASGTSSTAGLGLTGAERRAALANREARAKQRVREAEEKRRVDEEEAENEKRRKRPRTSAEDATVGTSTTVATVIDIDDDDDEVEDITAAVGKGARGAVDEQDEDEDADEVDEDAVRQDEARQVDWDSFDKDDLEDPMMVAEYVKDIYQYLRELEKNTIPDVNYMDHQNEINWSMRGILMDWLIETHVKFRLLPETILLAANIVDRFLSVRAVSLVRFQLVGVAALFIACKYEEVCCPSVANFLYMTEDGYKEEDVLQAERYVLKMLDYDLSYPNPINYLRRISKGDDYDITSRTFAKYFIEIATVDHRLIGTPPSLLAAAGVFMARKVLDRGHWTDYLAHLSGYQLSEILPTAQLMFDYCSRTADLRAQAAKLGRTASTASTGPCSLTYEPTGKPREAEHPSFYKKYSTRKFYKASSRCADWAADQPGKRLEEFDEVTVE